MPLKPTGYMEVEAGSTRTGSRVFSGPGMSWTTLSAGCDGCRNRMHGGPGSRNG